MGDELAEKRPAGRLRPERRRFVCPVSAVAQAAGAAKREEKAFVGLNAGKSGKDVRTMSARVRHFALEGARAPGIEDVSRCCSSTQQSLAAFALEAVTRSGRLSGLDGVTLESSLMLCRSGERSFVVIVRRRSGGRSRGDTSR